MTRCPAYGNRIQQAPLERSTRSVRPLKLIVVEHIQVRQLRRQVVDGSGEQFTKCKQTKDKVKGQNKEAELLTVTADRQTTNCNGKAKKNKQ